MMSPSLAAMIAALIDVWSHVPSEQTVIVSA
jgi:hypothetical protein